MYKIQDTKGGKIVLFHCPKCEHAFKTPLENAGKSVTCPHCGHTNVIPGESEKITEEKKQWAAMESAMDADLQKEEEFRRRKNEQEAQKHQQVEAQIHNPDIPSPDMPFTDKYLNWGVSVSISIYAITFIITAVAFVVILLLVAIALAQEDDVSAAFNAFGGLTMVFFGIFVFMIVSSGPVFATLLMERHLKDIKQLIRLKI